MRSFITAILAIAISGCSLKAPEHRPAYTPEELAMISDCRAWVKSIETNSNNQIDSVPENQKAFVIMHRDTVGMIESVWGKNRDICQPESSYAVAYKAYTEGQADIAIAAMKESGATARAVAYVAGVFGVSGDLSKTEKTSDTSVTTTTTTETPVIVE